MTGGVTTVTLIIILPSVKEKTDQYRNPKSTAAHLVKSFTDSDLILCSTDKKKRNASKRSFVHTKQKNDCGQTGNSDVRSRQVSSSSILGSDFSFLCGSSLH